MEQTVYTARRERLRTLMQKQGLEALLVSHAANRYYLSGFELHDPQCNESAGRLLIMADGKDWLCTDSRYLDAARRLWDADRILIYGADAAREIGQRLGDVLGSLGTKGKPRRVGFEAASVSVAFYDAFVAVVGAGNLCRAERLVESLRVIKDAEEIRRMRASCALNQQLMRAVPDMLQAGRSETAVAWDIERFFREHGASELAFSSIVARGVNGALPHAIPSEQALIGEEEPVLVDVGARFEEYCSDQTRTFWVGKRPHEAFTRTLAQVQEAQQRAIEGIRAGVRACDVYQMAREVFEQHGVASFFTHSLGHGVGLETHEAPGLNSRNQNALEAGMIVTVEPGLYYPEWGGVRWEYMVLVTENGCTVL